MAKDPTANEMFRADVEQEGCYRILDTQLFKLAAGKRESELQKDQQEDNQLE